MDQSGGMDQGNHITPISSKSHTEHGGDVIQKTSSAAADKEVTRHVQLDTMDSSSSGLQGNSMGTEGAKVREAAASQLELKDKSLKTIMRSHLIHHQNTLEDL